MPIKDTSRTSKILLKYVSHNSSSQFRLWLTRNEKVIRQATKINAQQSNSSSFYFTLGKAYIKHTKLVNYILVTPLQFSTQSVNLLVRVLNMR